MITGILSIVFMAASVLGTCFCALGIFGVAVGMVAGVVAIVLGFMARARNPGSGGGLTGVLTGFASLLFGLVIVVLMIIVGVGFVALMNAQPPAGGPGGNPNFNNPRRF